MSAESERLYEVRLRADVYVYVPVRATSPEEATEKAWEAGEPFLASLLGYTELTDDGSITAEGDLENRPDEIVEKER